jgi:hypothetical protein
MLEFFKSGGYAMVPILIFGFLLIAASGLYLLRPERRLAPLIWSTGALTAGMGLLGFFLGVRLSLRYIWQVEPADQLKIAAAGIAESLNDVILALILVVLGALLAAIGAYRSSRRAQPSADRA